MKRQQKNNSISAALYNWYRQALKHTKYRWFVILGTLFYLINPFDISPDALPIIGWIDDGVIVSLLITEVGQMMSEELKRKRLFQTTQKMQSGTEAETETAKTITIDAVAVS